VNHFEFWYSEMAFPYRENNEPTVNTIFGYGKGEVGRFTLPMVYMLRQIKLFKREIF